MRNALVMVGVVVGVVASPFARAQPQTGLFRWEVSSDGGASWHSSITVNSGDAYKMRAWASYTDGPVRAIGFAGVDFEQIDFINADETDVFGGVSGSGRPTFVRRMQFDPRVPDGMLQTWLLKPGTGASANGLKLDQVTDSQRIALSQIPKIMPSAPGAPPYDGFDASNPIMVFEMDAVAGDAKMLTISATWFRSSFGGSTPANDFKVYTTETGTWKRPAQEAVMASATVYIVPGPGGVGVVIVAMVAGVGRRRGR